MRKTLIGISLLLLGATAATAQDATYFITHMSQLTQLWQSAGLTAKYPYRYALVDIDGDGASELWLRSYDGMDQAIVAGAKGKKPALLAATNGSQLITVKGSCVILDETVDNTTSLFTYTPVKGSAKSTVVTDKRTVKGDTYGPDAQYKHQYTVEGMNDAKKANKYAKNILKNANRSKAIDAEQLTWAPITDMGLYWASNTTRRERPVMLTADIEGNRFAYDPATLDNAQPYKYMAFKSTVNEIVPAGTGSFQLKKAALKTKMFRGYASHEVFPIAFTAATRKSHSFVPFSRWKSGEKKQSMSTGTKNSIEALYDRSIVRDQWLAQWTDKNSRRGAAAATVYNVYAVWMDGAQISPLTAIVLMKGDAVEATYDVRSDVKQPVNYVDNVPEIQCVCSTPDTPVELYIHQVIDGKACNIVLDQAAGYLLRVR